MKPLILIAILLPVLVCCGDSNEGALPGMPPAQETPEQYIERIKKSDMPEDEKRATIERFEANRKMIEEMKAQAEANKPKESGPAPK